MPKECPKCGYQDNREIARFCRSCGAQLDGCEIEAGTNGPYQSTPCAEVPPDAMVHFNWARGAAIDLKDDDLSGWRKVADELSLAIEKAGGAFPKAHALLGMTMTMLGDKRKAKQAFNRAVQQDDCNVTARAGLIFLDLESLGTRRLPLMGEWTDLLVIGIGAAANRRKMALLRAQIAHLTEAFQKSMESETSIRECIAMADLVLEVHDAAERVATPRQRSDLAQGILDAPWDRLDTPPDLGQQVADIRHRARDRTTPPDK
jgi:hypothetical protein